MELLTLCKAQAQCTAANEECKVNKDCCDNQCVTVESGSKTGIRICEFECQSTGDSCGKNEDCCKGNVCIRLGLRGRKSCTKYVEPPPCKDIGGSCLDVTDCCDVGNRECKPLPVNGIWYERTCQIRKCREEGKNCSPEGSHGNCCDNLTCNQVGTCV